MSIFLVGVGANDDPFLSNSKHSMAPPTQRIMNYIVGTGVLDCPYGVRVNLHRRGRGNPSPTTHIVLVL